MKIRASIAALIMIVIISGCKNNGNSGVSVGNSYKVKQSTNMRGLTTQYFYTSDGKIAYTIAANGAKTTYTYNGKTINQQLVDSSRNLFIKSVVVLNEKGFADSTIASDESGTYIKTYVHDGNGFIIESKDFVSGTLSDVATTVVKDANEVSTSIADSSLKKMFTVYFDYIPEKVNSLRYENYGMQFLGTDSRGLMKKFVQMMPTGDTIRVSTFNYHFDDKGRVTQKIMYDGNGMVKDSTSYIYY